MKEKIELRPAYVWDCGQCGREVFVRAIIPEMSEEDSEEMKKDVFGEGEEEGEFGFFMSLPEVVTCPYCNEEFVVQPYGVEDYDPDSE
jgi:hypothetical protein